MAANKIDLIGIDKGWVSRLIEMWRWYKKVSGAKGDSARSDNPQVSDSQIIAVKITSNAAGGEKYNGRILSGSSAAVAAGDLSMPEGLTLPSADNCLVVNAAGTGKSTHFIPANTFHFGKIIGYASSLYVVQISVPTANIFPVTVTSDGGANGSKTTAASYTYTVKDVTATTTLGTSIALAKTRSNGTVTAGSTYGLAFYDGSTLKLWDAGERPGTGGC